jgi:hydrogenase maturation factor
LAGEEVLVLKSDPITFTGRDAAFHAVTVNVNDVASCGASPRWLLATLLFPVGITPGEILRVMKDLQEAARANGLILCGGHTEVTDAVTRLVASAQVAGTVSRCGLIDKRNMRPGHRIVLTKRLAVEGTGIIAAEFPSVLKEIGMSEEAVGECRRLMRKPGTSIRKEAEIAACASGVSAMHDVTEGGLATALEELSLAGAHRIRIDASRIPVYDETRSICRLLGLDPLGLIGSGSLVIVCRPDSLERLLGDLRRSGIEATCLGEVLGEGCGVEAVDGKGNRLPWPRFETDEIARLFSGLRGEPPNGLSGGTGSPE